METSQRCALSLDATLQQRTRHGQELHGTLQHNDLHHVALSHLQQLADQHRLRVELDAF